VVIPERREEKMARIFVIGIGFRPLENRAKGILADSKQIFASERLLEVFRKYDDFEGVRDRLKINDSVGQTMEAIKAAMEGDPVCVVTLLASGDPMFFGIGRRVVEEFGKEMVAVLPDLSSAQQAFARIGEPWDDAFFISMHGGPDPARRRELEYGLEDIPILCERHKKVLVLTDTINNPSVIARAFAAAPDSSAVIIHVCEKLSYPDEKITSGMPHDIAAREYLEPNLVIIVKRTPSA
jgi:precorrin-6B C5,15-methyltransferase / cobalt-precorrin-6B C5,C15-methyltransferase